MLLTSCVNVFSLADLQDKTYQYPQDINKAKSLIKEMGEAHAIHKWNELETYNVIFEDTFFGFLGKQANPFKEADMTFSLDYIPGTFNGQLEFLSGKDKGNIHGIQSWKTYQKIGDTYELKPDKVMTFWIPTYQYFIEFPARIQEATAVDYIGQKTVNDIRCEGVLASWNTVDKQKEIDQYIIWMDAESKRIVKIEYTVRDAYQFITGAASFTAYKEFDGILLPTVLPVESNLVKEGFMHSMQIKEFTRNKKRRSELEPLK